MTAVRRSRIGTTAVALGLACASLLLGASPAQAAEGSIDFVDQQDGTLQILYSVPSGEAPDLDSIAVSLGDISLEATAEPAGEAVDAVTRTSVLAMDVSNSMAGDRFEAAKAAAITFIDRAPEDLNIGLVTFAGDVTTVAAPTTDHDTVRDAIDGLALSQATRLYEGVSAAIDAAGAEGARSVLLLADGADSTDTPITAALEAITAANEGDEQVTVNVVAIAQSGRARQRLQQLAAAGEGSVIDADDPSQLGALFSQQADAIAQQILVTAVPSAALLGVEGQVQVTVNAGGEIFTDSTFVSIDAAPTGPARPSALAPVERGFQISQSMMLLGLGGAGVAIAVLVIAALGGFGSGSKQDAVDRTIEAYTRQGAKKMALAANEPSQSVTQQAVGAASKMLSNNKDLESKLGTRLEAAGMQIKPAEWLLIHVGLAVGAGLVGLLITSGGIIGMAIGLFFGVLGPWAFLGFKRSRRVKAFNAQLADTLQLIAGSLSAGLSLAQSVDTVVREGQNPIGTEFRRALIETRLGVEIEDALSGIAERMESKDFEWVIMAIRIQREVGGNLAELLNKVAETIREREYLERQVLTLSAEGRLSVWILGGLPPAFIAYLAVANPTYLEPLFTTTIGWLMLGLMVVLEVVGVFWMKRVVKVEV